MSKDNNQDYNQSRNRQQDGHNFQWNPPNIPHHQPAQFDQYHQGSTSRYQSHSMPHRCNYTLQTAGVSVQLRSNHSPSTHFLSTTLSPPQAPIFEGSSYPRNFPLTADQNQWHGSNTSGRVDDFQVLYPSNQQHQQYREIHQYRSTQLQPPSSPHSAITRIAGDSYVLDPAQPRYRHHSWSEPRPAGTNASSPPVLRSTRTASTSSATVTATATVPVSDVPQPQARRRGRPRIPESSPYARFHLTRASVPVGSVPTTSSHPQPMLPSSAMVKSPLGSPTREGLSSPKGLATERFSTKPASSEVQVNQAPGDRSIVGDDDISQETGQSSLGVVTKGTSSDEEGSTEQEGDTAMDDNSSNTLHIKLIQSDFTDSHLASSSRLPTHLIEDKEERKKQQNRDSAKRFRERTRTRLAELEDLVSELRKKLDREHIQIEILKEANAALKRENEDLHMRN